MSRQVDERVVSMQFDNKHFEANVKTSMSTIDKLKAKLNFKGASKGLENVNSAAKKVNMSGISGAVDTVRSRFSAMEVVGVTALANITNSAVNAGKRIASALTIDPVRTGFNEYELKMGSIQTIMASTGESLETVNKYLNELNQYSDDTIYSFQDMTQNIGKFTNAGVKLEDAVAAIKGISNEAAVSGANANEAARSMYNFAQALSSGYVKLIDWKSIELANMATVDFKNQLLETAAATGTVTKTADGMYKTLDGNVVSATKNFNETLQDQWMTSEVLITTLKKYADTNTEIGKKATAAATEVKTFSQLLDTLKESAQSGWAQTWEIVFGDFNEGKKLWTKLSESVGGFLDKMAKARNSLLEGAFGSPWGKFNEEIEKAGVSTEDFQTKLKEVAKDHGYAVDDLIKEYGSLEKAMADGKISTNVVTETLKKLAGNEKDAAKSTEDMTDKLEYFQKVVNKVWHGDYANGEARVKALTEAGYDYAAVQDLVNKTVDGHKLTLDDLSDAQLKSVGYTQEQIVSIRKLAKEAETSGTDINTLISQMNKPTGRELLIDSFGNALQGLGAIMGSVKKAWQEIFPPMTSTRLYSIIEGINEFSKHLRVGEEAADKFKRTFKGIFAVLDIILTIVGGPIKIAFKLLTAILSEFDLSILDLTAMLGDAIVKFRDWIDNTLDFTAAAKKIVPPIKNAIKAFKGWIETLKTSDNIPRDIIKGLLNGLKSGISAIGGAAKSLGTKIIDVIKDVLGIHSPSKVMMAIGGFAALGLIIGFKDKLAAMFPDAAATVGGFIDNIKGVLGNIDWGTVFVGGLSVGTLGVANKIANALQTLASPFEGFADVLQGAGQVVKASAKVVKGFGKVLTNFGRLLGAMAFEKIANGLIKLAIAVAILVASIVALTLVDQDKLWAAVGVVGGLTIALSAILIIVTKLAGKLSEFSNDNKSVGGAASSFGAASIIASIGLAILAVAGAVLMLGKLPLNQLIQGGIALVVISGILVGLMAATRLIGGAVYGDKKMISNIGEFGKMFKKFAWSLLIIAASIKILGSMPTNELVQGGIAVGIISGVLVGLMAATRLLGGTVYVGNKKMMSNISEFGKMFKKFAWSLLIIAASIKIFGTMPTNELVQGGIAVGVIIAAVVGIMAATRLLGTGVFSNGKKMMSNIGEFGKMFMKFSISLLLIAAAIKLFGIMPKNELIQGGAVAGIIVGVLIGIMAATKLLTTNRNSMLAVSKVGVAFLAMSASLLLIAMAMKSIGRMPLSEVIQGGTVVLILMGAMVGIMAATKLLTKNADSVKGLVKVGVMMLLMSGAIAVLAGAMHIIAKLDPDRVMVALGTIMTLMIGFAGVMAVTKLINPQNGSIGVIIACIAGIAVLAGALVGLSFVDPKRLRSASLGLSAALVAFGVLIGAMALLSKYSGNMAPKKVIQGAFALTALAVPLLAIAGILILMSAMNVTNAIPNAIALSGLLIVLIAVAMAIGKLGTQVRNITLGSVALLAMTAVMAALGLVLGMMSAMNVTNAMTNGIVLSVMMLVLIALAASMAILGRAAGKIALGSAALLALVAVMAALGLVLGMMSALKVDNALKNGLVLATLLIVMTGVAAALAILGSFAVQIALGALALTALVVPMACVALILAMMSAMDVQSALPNAIALSTVLTVMTLLLIPLTLIGPLAVAAITGIGVLLTFITAVGAFVIAVGALMEKFPALESFIDKGIPVLEKLANGIGSIIGNFVSGFLTGVVSGLPEIGTQLSMFITNAMPFINGVKMVDESVLSGVARLTGAILLLTAADVINSLTSFLPGSMVTMGQELSAFMMTIGPFIAGAKTLDAEMMAGVKSLAETILILTAADVLNGLTKWITGGSSLTEFGEQLPAVGQYLKSFSTNLGTFGEEQVNSVTCAANALKNMAEAADTMPKTGGMWQKLTGEGSISEFGGYLPKLASDLSAFVTNIGTFGEGQVNSVTCAANAIKSLAEAADKIPNEGGWWAKITGDNSIETFGGYLPGLGTNLSGFVTNLGTFTDAQVQTTKCASEALRALAEAANQMPENANFWEKLFGGDTQSLEQFGSQLPKLGTYLKNFISEIGTFNSSSIETVNSAVGALKAFAALGDVDLSALSTALPTFGEKIIGFAGKIKTFCSNMASVDSASLDASIASVNKLIDMFKNFESANSDAASKFSKSLETLGNNGINKFTSAFTDAEAKVKASGEKMLTVFLEGVESKTGSASDKFKKISTDSASDLKEGYQSFYNAGSYLVDGFVLGISENDYKATAKARAMAKAAAEAAEEELEINSPSKVFRRIGTSIPEGFAQGIDKLGYVVAHSSESMADTAVDGVRGSISNLGDVVGGDLSGQPTITPVLDLSEVRTGLAAISSMFGSNGQLGVSTDVNSIGYAMNHRGQNGANDDVVDAIGKLNDNLSDMDRPVYQIGNITLSGDDELAAAFETIIRYANIERRK